MEENQDDGFNEFRQELGADKVNEFLAKFGLGPNYKPAKRKTYPCPKCKKTNAVYKEEHADTDMNEMVLECPDCGYHSDQINEVKNFFQIRQEQDPDGTKHDLRLICTTCGNSHTCRCSKPKRRFEGLCYKCAGIDLNGNKI